MKCMASIEQIDVDKVLVGLKHASATATNEEELRIKASALLESEVISKLGITPGRYEYTFVSGGRPDALYGHVIIEYKAPGKLLREPDVAKAKEQLIGYVKKEAEVEDRFKLFLGVILADRIAFVRYDEKSKSWLLRGPYDLNRETVLRLVEAIRGLRRKKLAVEELLRDFGPKSDTAVSMVNVFYGKVMSSKSPKVEALFNDWKRLFSQVCSYSPEKLKGLEAEYGLTMKADYSALLFAVHTYYALVMKLLAAEVAYLFGAGKWLKSYVAELEDANMKGLDAFKRALEDLESGGVFKKFLNITNFIEGDYFSWYLEELDQETANKIANLAKKLADYEPATPVLEPEYTRDLLKRLYQNLVPKKIRHDLGEYYTPDWLAELLLNEVGLTGENFEKYASEKGDIIAPLNLRVLDPACGSGTFLILTIKRFREYAEGHYLKDVLATYVLRNVVGFDLNPLAVLAARTNYLLSIADLFGYVKGPIEIPIYLADSLLVETRTTLTGVSYVVRTYVGVFELPKSVVDIGILGRLLGAVDRYVRLRYRLEEFRKVAKEELDLEDEELQLVGNLYGVFLKLEEEGKNHVWTSIIKNAFAPLTITSSVGKFDYVIGNPPWINWSDLPSEYRDKTKDIWQKYGLLSRAKGTRLGAAERDIAMLFTYTSIEKYLRELGDFGFLITQSVFKSMAGEGFRRFTIYSGNNPTNFKIKKVHDLVELVPFEGAQNRTAIMIAVKGKETIYPVPYILWKGSKVDQSKSLEEVLKETTRIELEAVPLLKKTGPWSALTSDAHHTVKRAIGVSPYRAEAHLGVHFGLNPAYWVRVLDILPDGNLFVKNLVKGAKRRVMEVQVAIEKELVYPHLRGRDVNKWLAEPSLYAVLPTDNSGRTISIRDLQVNYPKAYAFFTTFFQDLTTRTTEPYKTKLKPWREEPKDRAEKMAPPFYMLFNVAPSLSAFKVVFRRVATGLVSAVIGPRADKFLGTKVVTPNEKLVLVTCENENEAHYICAVLNSSIARLIAKSYVVEIQISAHIFEYIRVPQYAPDSKIHLELARLSKEAHKLASENNVDELSKVEEEIDNMVARLYGLTDEELKEIKNSLKLLEGEEVEEEIVEEASMEVTVDFLNAVASPNVAGSFEVAITNPSKETVEIELQLPDRKVRLETDKEQETIRVKTPPLPKGEHKIPYKIITEGKVAKGEFTLHVKEKKRFRKEESLTGKLDELLEES
jgi:methylase of polypeptide subunit release factors